MQVLEVITFNMMSRVIGILLRSILIVMGISLEIIIFFGGLIILTIWLTVPLLISAGLWLSLMLIF